MSSFSRGLATHLEDSMTIDPTITCRDKYKVVESPSEAVSKERALLKLCQMPYVMDTKYIVQSAILSYLE